MHRKYKDIKMASKENLEQIVKGHVLYAMGAGLIPVPGLDVTGVTLVQLDMLKKIAQEYEADFSEHQLKAILAALGSNIFAKIGANSGWFIPAVGQTVSQLTMSALSGALTYAISQVYIKYLEDGKLFDFNSEKYKDFFNEQFEKGKEFVKNLGKKNNAETDPVEKLKELADLKDKGAISEEEYKTMKEKLFASL
ncbi:MAG: hypothetical protein KatS3mg035_1476 [Bacteroidia bacterium]|nr:MAG: hypothetical protein KatS3mg035_1476 [Bacteroidia bacterium]